MKPGPPWLAELHRQWLAARGRRAAGAVKAYARDWEPLLDAAGLHTAEERAAAVREAAALAGEGRVVLARHRYRQFIERIRVPVEQEGWLRARFGSDNPADLRERSVAVVQEAMAQEHPRLPELWRWWCGSVLAEFSRGRTARPLHWRQPEVVRRVLRLVYDLTAREWAGETPVRDASMVLGLDSKGIERHRHVVEAALGGLFQQRGMTLGALNLEISRSVLTFHGPLTLHLPGGAAAPSGLLRHASSFEAAELGRASHFSTTAGCLLTVENSKTSFRHAVAANAGQGALVVATAFPTRAVRLLLERLPRSLPHYHFGDTDAAGYFILQKLREVVPGRPVIPWQMEWRQQEGSPELTGYDRRVAGQLLEDAAMQDVHGDLRRMLASGRKGDFEQEGRKMVLPGG